MFLCRSIREFINLSVIDASMYLRHFSSDRSHMYNSETNTYNSPPPAYTCILQQQENENIKNPSNNWNDGDEDDTNTKSANNTSAIITHPTTTFEQYRIISNQDINSAHEENKNGSNSISTNIKNYDIDDNHSPIFGQVYSLSQLLKRFFCPENSRDNKQINDITPHMAL